MIALQLVFFYRLQKKLLFVDDFVGYILCKSSAVQLAVSVISLQNCNFLLNKKNLQSKEQVLRKVK